MFLEQDSHLQAETATLSFFVSMEMLETSIYHWPRLQPKAMWVMFRRSQVLATFDFKIATFISVLLNNPDLPAFLKA